MRRVTTVAMVGIICMLTMAAGCGKSDGKSAEATEATEPVSEISITTDAVEPPAEPVEAEIEEYDFSVTEDNGEESETVSEDIVAETDEYGITTIDEIKVYTTDKVRMRKEPNTDADVAGMLDSGEEVTATGKSDEWHRIKNEDGEIVYVKSEYLTETKPEKKTEETPKEEKKAEEKKTETASTAATTTDTSAADAAAKALQEAAAQQAAAQQQVAAQQQEAAQQAAATAAASVPVVSAGKYKNYDFTEAQIANDWNSHGYSQTIGKSWNQLSEGEKADVANHYSHYGAAGW